MYSVDEYQLFLFDFDGLLVNTEKLHFIAYKTLAANHGGEWTENFAQYCEACHSDANGPQKYLCHMFPHLKALPWKELYREKCDIYSNLVKSGETELMPGAYELLSHLEKKGVTRAVVTHSSLEHITLLRAQHEILNTIPHWITREDYSVPKPSPECYKIAIERLAKPGDRVIGFEDSPRGLEALKGADLQPVIVGGNKHLADERVVHLDSLTNIAL